MEREKNNEITVKDDYDVGFGSTCLHESQNQIIF
jgi:hypothetical protein